MGSKEDILARLKKHAVDQVERPEMTFEPLTFSDPLAQFEKLRGVGERAGRERGNPERVPRCQVDRVEFTGSYMCHGESRHVG